MNYTKLIDAIKAVENSTDKQVQKVYTELKGFDRRERNAVRDLAIETGIKRKTLDYYTIQAHAWNRAAVLNVSAVKFRTEMTKEIKRIGTKQVMTLIDGWATLDGADLAGLLELLEGVEIDEKERPTELEIFIKHMKAGHFDESLEWLVSEVLDYAKESELA